MKVGVDYKHTFEITYSLRGQEYTQVLDELLALRGEDFARMEANEIEKISLDLGYYQITLSFALKELFSKWMKASESRDIWLSKLRREKRVELREARNLMKQEKKKVEELNQQELLDEIIAECEEEYKRSREELIDLEADYKFLQGLMSRMDQQTIRIQGILRRRAG